MKPKDKNSKPGAGKQKKQVLVLGGLVAVLGVVVAVQFGGSEPAPEVAALAQDVPSASAPATSSDPGQPAAASSGVAAAPAPASGVADNPVLSKPSDTELPRSPFSNFWSVATTGSSTAGPSGALPEIAPPQVTLNATMPSDVRPMAVIDGELFFVGDQVQGWELSDVQERRVVLRSPSQAMVTVEMALLLGSRTTARGATDG